MLFDTPYGLPNVLLIKMWIILLVSSFRQILNFKVQMLAANELISYPSDSLEENLTLVGNHGRPAG